MGTEMDWDKLRIFHAVADAGSLTHAGDALHLSQSAVSRQIRSLEESLNTTLFHRHARGLILTEQGELLFDATASMVKRIDAATARIRDSEEEVFGELKVTTTHGFGVLWLAPRLTKLYEKFPDLKIDLMLEERVLDLPDPYSSVSGEAVEHLGDVLQRRPVSRIRDGDVELPQPFDRLEVVRDTPRIFGDPRGITPSQKHVPRKQRAPLGPVKAQVIRGVTGRVNRHELPLVGLDRVAINQKVVDVLDPLRTPHRGTDRIRQLARRSGMVPVPVCQHDHSLGRVAHRRNQSPDVVCHVRARVDHCNLVLPHQEGASPVERECARVTRDQVGRLLRRSDSYRRSAASCSASLSAMLMSAISSSSVNAASSSESTSICPKISSPARIRITSSDRVSGEHTR